MTPPTGSAVRTYNAGNAPYLAGAKTIADFSAQNEMLDGLKDTMVQTMSELRELMDNAPHEVLSEMARRMRDQLQQGGMLEIEDRLIQMLERKDNLLKGVFGGNVWDDIRKEMEEIERRETRENQIGNARQDANEAEQQRAEELRRQQEWESKTHNVAGVEMTGIEIDDFISAMSDPAQRQAFIERRARERNIPEEQARRELELTIKYMEALRRIEQGRGTAEDRAFVNSVDNNPEQRAAVQSTARSISNREDTDPHKNVGQRNRSLNVEANIGEAKVEKSTTPTALPREIVSVAETVSTATGSGILATANGNVINLTGEFTAAGNGVAPPVTPAPAPPTPTPLTFTQVASAPSGGAFS